MIPKYSSALWTAIAPALGNHLWQSTLFAIAAGLLTLILRNNHARARYWLWLAASVKFLIPFSLLIGMGSHLARSHGSAGTNGRLYFAMEQVGQPFTQPAMSMISRATPTTAFSSLIHLLPALLAGVWLCGFVVVLCVWYARWRRISVAVREALPLREGREVEALRRLERLRGMPKRIEVLLSRTSLEPGIFGIARPILVWPERISDRLEDAHLEAILAHELWHVRRRDNLAAAIHMLVEAIFWFHPLVWWLGARLVEERERACDEEVLESGSDRQVYAESILKICEFCVGSPLACVSGVTGADLKKRITRIMTEQVARKLDFSRRLLLTAAAILAVAAPIATGMLHANPRRAPSQTGNMTAAIPAYATVSITSNKSGSDRVALMFGPNEFISKNASLQQVIRAAYGVEDDRISGAPDWLRSEKYDVEAKEDGSGMDDPRKLSFDEHVSEQKRMLQALLADRLKLSLHRETRDLTVYALVIAKNGPKLQESKPGDTYPNGHKDPDGVSRPGGIHFEGQKLIAQGVPVGPMLFHLSRQLHRTVVDETALSGTYDFTLKLPDGVPLGIDNPAPPESYEPAVSAAIEQQLGLKLETRKASMEIFVIDHVERPAESQSQNTTATSPVYQVASVKLDQAGTASLKTGKGIIRQRLMFGLGTFTGENVLLQDLIRAAYRVEDYQISGAPDWFTSELYDVDAKAEKSAVDEMQKLGNDQRNFENQGMLQVLLQDRFKLSLRHETKDLPIYSLVVAEAGKLHEAQGDCGPPPPMWKAGMPPPPPPCGNLRVFAWVGRLDGLKVPITQLVASLSARTRRKVLDKTNLGGKYDIDLVWDPDPSEFPPRPAYLAATYQPDPNSPPLLTAIQRQLGLKLEPQTAPVELLVIDHAEKPSEN
jgi:bla regulator protein blaR1